MKIKIKDMNDAQEIVKIAESYKDYDIDCICGRYVIDLKSIMGVLSLGLPKVVDVKIRTDNDIYFNSVQDCLKKWRV